MVAYGNVFQSIGQRAGQSKKKKKLGASPPEIKLINNNT